MKKMTILYLELMTILYLELIGNAAAGGGGGDGERARLVAGGAVGECGAAESDIRGQDESTGARAWRRVSGRVND